MLLVVLLRVYTSFIYFFFFSCSQYPIEDDEDYDGIDLLNFFIAMTLLSGDDDDEDFEDYEFPFDLDEEYEY